MDERIIQYFEETTMNDFMNGINLSRDNSEKRLNKEKQDSNNLQSR